MADVHLSRQIVVRVSQEMHQALVEDAGANGRTVAQTVRHILRNSWLDIMPPIHITPPKETTP